MEELIKKLVTEVGITEEQAKKAVEIFKKEAQQEGFMDKLGDWAEEAKEKLEDLAEEAGEALGKAKNFVAEVWNKVTGGDEKEKKQEEKKEEEKK
ncbi:MAG: hypothetical protein RMJ97_03575 [Raineya sp.]|nr:hypothetical protein [Raineya sp.]